MCLYMFMLALADTGKYITEGLLSRHWQIQVNTLLKDVSVCFYMSMLALADTGKYITEACMIVFLSLCVGTGR